jgi:hypothetical protein
MKIIVLSIALVLFGLIAFAQFEQSKIDADGFDQVKVKVGGDFALQLQALDHNINGVSDSLVDLKNNFNLPAANLSLTTDLAPGIQLYMNVFLSSRHHNESWVEGGYLTIDRLPFLPAADEIMKHFTIKAGVMMPNYGDAHFFRSTNASVLNNPFVGNLIMDAYTTNPGMEIMFRKDGILAMVGTNNGRMNYGRGNDIGQDMVFNFKVGYDKQITDDLRVRGSFSGYYTPEGHSGSTLWAGDRAGARYYDVMLWHNQPLMSTSNYRTGRWDPASGQSEMFSFMANLFVQFHGLEVFGVYENMTGILRGANQHFTQTAVQALYRIGNFYVGTRLNNVSDNSGSTVSRLNLGGGWFMTDNVLVKLDYVNQNYSGPAHKAIDGGQFNGLVMEAAISF